MAHNFGFIGAGNMGGAMIAGLAASKDIKLHGFDPDKKRLHSLEDSCGLIRQESPLEVAEKCEYIFYAVKPGLLKSVIHETLPALDDSKCLISIAAGIQLSKIISWCENACSVIRIMPNTPALIDRGVFAVCLEHEKVTSAQKDIITSAVNRLGLTFVLPEQSFDLFTGLIGSGPAYVFYFMDSMIEAGVLLGMDRKNAAEMVKELFAGSSEMSLKIDKSITEHREMVTSPGGTTAAGLSMLEKHAVKSAIMEAVKKAAERSAELGRD